MGPERYARISAVLDRRQPDLTVLMERVNKVHNFSAILRTCDAAGVMSVHAVPTERGLPLPHHTSAGSTKWVEVIEHSDASTAIRHLQAQGMTVLAAHLSEGAQDFRSVDLTGPTAFMVGAELHGISPEAVDRADGEVVIPMRGMVQSLNVSVATALLLFEAVRQREAAGRVPGSRLEPETRNRILFEWAYPRVAERLRARGIPYPVLDEDGGIPQSFTRSIRRSRSQH